MPIISQNLTLPGNVQTGGTIEASDVATLYQTMNAFTIPNSVGVWTQGLVNNDLYQSTAGGTIDWSFSASASKAVFFMLPVSWSNSTGNPVFLARLNGTNITTFHRACRRQAAGVLGARQETPCRSGPHRRSDRARRSSNHRPPVRRRAHFHARGRQR